MNRALKKINLLMVLFKFIGRKDTSVISVKHFCFLNEVLFYFIKNPERFLLNKWNGFLFQLLAFLLMHSRSNRSTNRFIIIVLAVGVYTSIKNHWLYTYVWNVERNLSIVVQFVLIERIIKALLEDI